MQAIGEAKLTVSEAAFVTGVDKKVVDREVDGRIIPSKGKGDERRLEGADLYYLCSIKNDRSDLGTGFRKKLRRHFWEAVSNREPEVVFGFFHVILSELESDFLDRFRALEAARKQYIEHKPGVVGGEPVIKGTRLAVRYIADLLKQGASHTELREEFDLTDAQIDAAALYDKVTPRRGRPATKQKRSVHVPVAG